MKKIFYILCLMAGLTAAAQAQGTAPLTVQEVDGSPKKNGVTKIIVSNGTLTCTGTVCTIVTGGGGGSPGGSSSQVQYNDGAGGFAGSSGITLSATQATLVAPILGAATATSITASTAGLNFSGTNTTDNASVQLMLLRGNRATVTTNDEAYVSLSLANAAAAQKEVARLTWAIFPNTAGAEGGRMDFSVMSSGTLAKRVQLSPTDFSPSSDDGAGLGAVGTLQWSDLFLASGGVIGWNNNNYTITHSAGNLAFSGTASFATALTTGSASFDLLNTTATTINFGGAATALNMAGGSGAVVTLGGAANAASLRFMEPSGSGTNYTEFKAQAQGGNVTYTLPAADGSNGQVLSTNGSGALSWATSGGGLTIGTTAITSGTAGRILYETSGNVVGEIAGSSADANGAVQFAATARSSGVAQYFRINTPADTGITADTESVGVYFGGNGSGATVTRTLADGTTLATQRENVFVAPTYAAAGATTITYASTLAITGAPIAGSSVTLTRSAALQFGISGTSTGMGILVNDATGAGSTNRIIDYYDSGNTNRFYLTPASLTVSVSTFSLNNTSGVVRLLTGTAYAVDLQSPVTYATELLFRAATTNIPRDQSSIRSFWTDATDATRTSILQFYTVTSAAASAEVARLGSTGFSVGTTTIGTAQAHIASISSSRVALRVDSAATPSVDIVQFTNNGTNRWALNSSTTATTTTTTGPNGGTNVVGVLMESITLSTSGTTTDSTIDLPANSIILSVTGRITTTITTATDWKLGDATITDRFSDANATLTSGTTTVGINQWKADRTTAGQGPFQQSTAKVRITTTGTPGAGVIRITVHYITLTPPTS